MVKNLYKWLMPILTALLLFICIRLVTDVPNQQYYWTGNTPYFMLVEIGSIIVSSYLLITVLYIWLRWNRKQKKGLWVEYGGLFLLTTCWCVGTMLFTWGLNERMFTLQDVAIPEVIAVLFVFLTYTFMRNQAVEKEYAEQRLQLEKIKNDQLQTELKFLKAQYHPHFLFNVLNTVYFQIDEKNKAPRHTLEILSDLLRYQLYNAGDQVVFQVEIDYLKRYISLCQLRCSERLQLQTSFDEALKEQEISPLLFIPLVENAFKYVGGDYHIDLNMSWKEGKLIFDMMNSKPLDRVHKPTRQGIGLDNLRRRLVLLYPDKHKLEIKDEPDRFTVKLIIEPDNV